MAAQESTIMNFAQRLAGTGTVVRVSKKDIMALSAAMASVGINAESGGSAMSKVLTKMNNAVKDGGEKLQGFASVAGVSGQEFAKTWENDPYKAVQQFEQGLANQNKEGKNVKEMLKDLGITELRETDTVLRLANGNKQLQTARENANKGYKEGNALSQEAETKYKTLGNQMKIFMNHVRDLGIEIGSALSPILIGMMKVLTPVIDALAKAPAPIKLMVVALGLIPIVAVPVLGSLAAITGAMGLMGQAMNTATYAAGRNSKALRIYAVSMGLLTSPIKTTKKALSSLPGLFGRVGKSAQSGAKATSSTGTVLAKTGGQAAKSGSLFGKFASKLKFLAPIGSLLTGVMSTLLTALAALSAPVIIAVTVIGSLVAAFVVAYKKVGWFRDGINGLLYVFKVFGGNIISGAINKVKEFGKWVGDVAGSVGGWAVDKFKSLWKAMEGTAYGKATKKNISSFKKGMQELGKASQKSTDQVKVLGKGVSEGTKKALGGYVKYSQKSTEIMAQMRLNNGKESQKLQDELIKNSEDAGKELVNQQKKRNKINVNQLQKMLIDTKAFTGAESEEIINRAKKTGSEKVKKTEELNKEIRELEEKALADGTLSEKERKAIQAKYDERNKIAVKTLSQGQKEQRAIMSRLDTNVGAINTKEAQDAIKEVINAQDKAIADAKKKRNKLITEADDALANGTITQKEHDKIVKKVQSQYKTETDEAIKKGKESKKKIKKASPGIEELVNMDSGKSYSKAQQWWNQFSGGFTKEMSKAWANMSKNASNFGKLFVDGMMDIGAWIMNVKAKADSFWNQFGTALAQGASNVVGAVGGGFSSLGTTIVNGIMNIGSWVMQVRAKANSFWNSFGTTLVNAAVNIGQAFLGIGAKIWNGIKQGWNTIINSNPGALWTSLTSALGTAWEATKQWFITKGQQMGSAISTGWSAMKGFVVNTFSSIWTSVKVIWRGIWSTISYWAGAIWNRVKSVWAWIKNNTTLVFTSVWNFIKWIWTSIKNTIVYWTGAIWNRIKGVWGWIKNNTVGAFTFVWNTIKRIWSGIKNTIVYWTQAVWNRIKAVWAWIKSNTLNAFNYVWNTIKRIWAGIKGTIVYWTSAIWNRVKSVWNWIKSNTASAFTWVWNKIKSIWSGIKGTITYWTGSIWGRIKAVWSWIKSHTSQVFSSVWNKIKDIWKGIKGTISYWAGAAWDKVKSIWNSLSKGTKDIFNGVKNYLTDKWNSIKDSVTGIVSKLWGKVKDTFTNMKDGIKGLAGKIGDTINDMVGGIKKGLNKLIEGVNWVSDKLGVKADIPKLHTGTESTHTQSFVSNGAISRPTLATVNDKGSGNGSGSNGHQEVIQKANGQMFAPKGRDVTVPLDKGDIVHSGKTVQRATRKGLLPKFSKGTGDNTISEMLKDAKKAKRKKRKHEHVGIDAGEKMRSLQGTAAEAFTMVQDALTGAGGSGDKKKKKGNNLLNTVGTVGGAIAGKTAKGLKATKAGLGAAGNWAKEKAGDLLDYVGNPGKLLNKILEEFGVSFGGVKGDVMKNLWGGMWSKLKKTIEGLFSGWLDDASEGDGDGKYIKYLDNITTPYSPNGPPKGYPFNWAHPGIDLPYKYEKVQTPLEGTVQTKDTGNVGFGHHVIVKAKPYDAIFGHMSKWAVKNGQHVNVGDTLGTSGNTGSSTGAHLHYEMNKHGMGSMTGHSIDPIKWLKSHNGSGGGKNSSPKAVQAWKPEVKKALGLAGLPQTSAYINAWLRQINTESTGNPKAVGPGSSEGNPKGLVQVKPGTFNAYKLSGHGNIFNGLDNLIAGMRYAKATYGGRMLKQIGVGGPYANGGLVTKHQVAEIGEGNKPEMVIPLTRKARAMQLIEQAKSFMGVNDEGSISTVDNNSSNDIITQLLQQNNRLLEALISTVQDKELVVDEESMVNRVSRGLGKKYKSESFSKGKGGY